MDENKKGWVKVTRWVARIWSLGLILLSLLVILTPDVNQEVAVPWTDWLNLSIVFISVLGLALAWRWERLGGWISVVALAVFSVLFMITVERFFPTVLIFLAGIGIPAALYLISSYAED
jgi:cytochrome bd-type quinol oxidase subunit 2